MFSNVCSPIDPYQSGADPGLVEGGGGAAATASAAEVFLEGPV